MGASGLEGLKDQDREPYTPTWTEEEVNAVKEALPKELAVFAKRLALGDIKRDSQVRSTIQSMLKKVSEAKKVGATDATPPTRLGLFDPIVRDLEPLCEFAKSSPVIKGRIYTRLREYLSSFGVEDEFLVNLGSNGKRQWMRNSTK